MSGAEHTPLPEPLERVVDLLLEQFERDAPPLIVLEGPLLSPLGGTRPIAQRLAHRLVAEKRGVVSGVLFLYWNDPRVPSQEDLQRDVLFVIEDPLDRPRPVLKRLREMITMFALGREPPFRARIMLLTKAVPDWLTKLNPSRFSLQGSETPAASLSDSINSGGAGSIRLYYDPALDSRAVQEILNALGDVYRACGGDGLTFTSGRALRPAEVEAR